MYIFYIVVKPQDLKSTQNGFTHNTKYKLESQLKAVKLFAVNQQLLKS